MEPDSPATPLDRSAAEGIARTLRAMADATRVQILSMIVDSAEGRRPVTELAGALGLSQPTISHHLRILADDGILDRSQEGRQIWYSVAPARMDDVFDSLRVDPAVAAIAPATLGRISDDLALRFAGTFSPETIEDYVHESYRLLVERAGIARYLPSLTARFAADRLRALASAEGLVADETPEVLFVCVQNAGRSQLASALLRSLVGDRVRVLTAGSAPAGVVNPKIVAALDEIGVSIGDEFSKPLTDEVVRAADFVITMGCGDACPIYPGRRYLDWDLPDPAALSMPGVRAVRDDIEVRVRRLIEEMGLVNSG